MTKRSTAPRYPESSIKDGRFGTATVREPWPSMTTAQRRIYELTGNPPQTSALDDVDDPFAPRPVIPQPQPSTRQVPKKPAKYRNTKCEHNGIKFDSQKERSRWFHLIQLQAAGIIRDLRLQVPFVLTERRQRDDGTWEHASKYVADFVYVVVATGMQVVEDVKSTATRKNRTYIQKRKQMLDKHGITVKEI